MIIPSFELLEDGNSIKCLECGMVSYNTNDIRKQYCGNCHEFHGLRALQAIIGLEKGMPMKARVKGMENWIDGHLMFASPNGQSIAFECDEGLPLTSCGIHRDSLRQTVPLLYDHAVNAYRFIVTGAFYEVQINQNPGEPPQTK